MRGFPQKGDRLCKRNTGAATLSSVLVSQNFDISLAAPEPYCNEEQLWFKIDEYSVGLNS